MAIRRTRSVADYFVPFFHFKWRALFCFALAVGLGVAYVTFAPKMYESEAKLFVRVGRENTALDPTVRAGETIGLNASRQEEMNSIIEHLKSRAVLEQTYEKLQVGKQPVTAKKREEAIQGLEQQLYISSPRTSNVANVWAKANSPEQAQAIVSTLVEVYLDEHMRVHRSNDSLDFFDHQVEGLATQLESAQQSLRDLKNQAGLASITGRDESLEDELSAVKTQAKGIEAALAAADAKLDSLRELTDGLPDPILRQMVEGNPDSGLSSIQGQVFELRVKRQEAEAKYDATHPTVVALDRQLAEIEKAFASKSPSRSELVKAILTPELSNKSSLLAQRDKLQAQQASLTAELKQLNDVEIEILSWQRRISQLESEYLLTLKNRDEARLDQRLRADRISNLSLLQQATFVALPISPRPLRTTALAIAAGLLLATGIVFVSNRIDPKFRSSQQLAAELGVATLGSIPRLRRRDLSPRTNFRASDRELEHV